MPRRLVAVLAIVLAATLTAPRAAPQSSGPCSGIQVRLQPFAYESLTVGVAAVALTAATHSPAAGSAAYALITTETDLIRWRADGTDPTAAEGHQAATGTALAVCGISAITQFRAIRSGAGDATIRVSYFRS